MAPSSPIVNGVAFIRFVSLQDMANPGSYKANPTLAAGDVQISKDGGAFANLATLPTVTPAAGVGVKVSLSATEMTADNVIVVFIDQTNPKEWADYSFPLETAAAGWNVGKTGYSLSAAGIQAIWDALASALTTVGSIGKRLVDDLTGDIFARLGAPVAASISADIDVLNDLISRVSIGSSAINTTATSGTTLTTGTAAAGTYASTVQLDGVYYQIQDTAGTLDMYFEFNVGANGVPVEAIHTGRVTSAIDSLKVYAYNWGTTSWEQIGTLVGIGTAVNSQSRFDLTTAHVGTGGNLGLVRVRFQNTGLVTANFYTDQILMAYSAIPDNSDLLLIKAKTDQLAFTVANQIDSNVLDWKSATAPAMTGDAFARLGAPAGASVSADVAAVKADTAAVKLKTDLIPAGGPAAATDYTAARAAKLDNLDATISSRSTYAGGDTAGTTTLLGRIPGTVQPQTGDSFARLGAPAGASVSADIAQVEANVLTGLGYVDTEVAAIKAKTDNLPAAPAAVSDIPTAAQNADKILGRNLAGGSDGGRTVTDGLRILRNKRSIAAGTLTVTQEDDATPAWTASVATAASNPVSSIDPA